MSSRWQVNHLGGDLHHVSAPIPTPGPGQIVLEIRAVALNYRDLLMISGAYNPRVPLPLVPCSDAVGVIHSVGPGVGLHLGDRRLPIFSTSWIEGPPQNDHLKTTLGGPLLGTLQTHLLIDAASTVAAPACLSDAEAATLPTAAVTAWHALELAAIGPGDTVLTLGTGGVSVFALQLAKARGAKVAITSSSDERLKICRRIGADAVFNYTSHPDWGRRAARWAGSGVKLVIEVGGAGTIAQSLRATQTGGTIALIGVLAGGVGEVSLVQALMRSLRLQGVFVGSRQHSVELCTAIDAHQLHPMVASKHPWSKVPEAFESLQQGGQLGKVVVELP